jgi:hypothetical protein
MGNIDNDQMSHMSIFNTQQKKVKQDSRMIGDDASKAYD